MTRNTLFRTTLGLFATASLFITSAGLASAAPAPAPGTSSSLANTVSTTFPALDTYHAGDLSAADVGRMDSHGDFIPWGANHWDCKPSTTHPNPVILLHGFSGGNSYNYGELAPSLKAAGFCVFSLNWGAVPLTPGYGYTDLREGAKELAAVVGKVRAATGAEKVDIVGHSAGGLMPYWYINKMGGDQYVGKFFALAPATRGTDMGGKFNQKTARGRFAVDAVVKSGHPGIKDLLPDSDFIREVSTPSLTRPDVQYAVLVTNGDTTVTPWQSQFLPAGPNVQNYLLQDLCPNVKADHVSITLNIVFLQVVQDFLAGKTTPIVCSASDTTPVPLHQYAA